MHIYHSALPWTPKSSLTRQIYQGQLATEAKLVNAVDATWNACIRTIPVYDEVHRVVFSPKGALLAALGENRIKVCDAVSGACLATFDGQRSVQTIAFSLDDHFLASGLGWYGPGTVKVWDVQTGNLIQTFQGHSGVVKSVAFSPCGTMVASGAVDKTIRVWNMSPDVHECCLEGHSGAVFDVCWSTDGSLVISGSEDRTVRIWDVSRRTCLNIMRAHTETVTSVASFQDLIASGSWDGTVKISDAGSGDVLQTIPTEKRISSVQFSIHGDKMMYKNRNSASIWDLDVKRYISAIPLGGHSAAFSPDTIRVASASGSFVKIWKTEMVHSKTKSVDHHSEAVRHVSFAPDGQLVASRSNRDVKIWDAASGECLFTFHSDGIFPIGFSPKSEFVACPRRKKQFIWAIWDVRTRCLVKEVECHTNLVALSSDGTRMASVSHTRIELWSIATGKCLARVEHHDSSRRISKIAFDVSGSSVLATFDDSGHTQSWSISPAPLTNSHSSKSATLSMIFVPVQERPSHQSRSTPKQCYYYKRDDEWMTDQEGKRILWVPPNRRDLSLIDFHGSKVAMGVKSRRVYMVDFSDVLLPSQQR
jgi:WD40 repeat protein